MEMSILPGEVYRVSGTPRGSAFRVLEVDGDTVHCFGGHGGYMAFRSFWASRVGPRPLPRSSWPARLLPRDERAEAERARSEKRTARRIKATA